MIKDFLEDLPKQSIIVLESADEQLMTEIKTSANMEYSIKVWETGAGEETPVFNNTFTKISLALKELNELAYVEWDEYKDRPTLKECSKQYHNALWSVCEIIADQKELRPLDITEYPDRDTFVAAICDYYKDTAPEKFSS